MEPLEWSHLNNVKLVVSCLLQHTLGGIAGLQAVEGAQQLAWGYWEARYTWTWGRQGTNTCSAGRLASI